MRRCPTCQRTFDDNMKFCQADGTPLVDEALPVEDDDPFKTVLAEPPHSAGAEPEFDPMKTMLATPPPVDLPPPSPFGDAFSVEPKDTGVKPPVFGDLSAPQFGSNPLPPNNSFPPSDPFSPQQQPSGNFGQPYSGGFDNAPNTPTFQEPDPSFGQQANFGQPPFGQPQNEWTPPPVPQTGWDNQGLGQNTPFSPPPVNATGQSKVLPTVSLVAGIVSLPGICCYLGLLLGPVALVTGFIGLNQIKSNPQQYGGRGLAIGGMVVGGVALVVQILLIILGIALNLATMGR